MMYQNELIAAAGGSAIGAGIALYGINQFVPGGGGRKLMASAAAGAVAAVAVGYFLK